MAGPTPSTDIVYKPVSGLALAGFGLACLYAGMVALATGVALVQGVPFFLPGWMILVAIAGLGVSLWAQAQIRASEGTRAGMKLARWGCWLSLVSGLGYLAYTTFTGFALTQQASAFLIEEQGDESGFFPHLQKGGRSFNVAFLLTMPPNERAGSEPDNDKSMAKRFDIADQEGKGNLSRFRDHHLVRAISLAGKGEVKVEPLGVQEWKFENRGYRVTRNYRISTPEMVLDVLLPLQSSEGSAEGDRRKWSVALPQARITSLKNTPLGENLQRLRATAGQFLLGWMSNQEKVLPPEFAKLDQTDWDRLLPREKEVLRAQIKSQFKELFDKPSPNRLRLGLARETTLTPWEKLPDGRLRLAQEFEIDVPGKIAVPPYHLSGRVWLETKGPLDPQALTGVPEWEVKNIEILRVSFPPAEK